MAVETFFFWNSLFSLFILVGFFLYLTYTIPLSNTPARFWGLIATLVLIASRLVSIMMSLLILKVNPFG